MVPNFNSISSSVLDPQVVENCHSPLTLDIDLTTVYTLTCVLWYRWLSHVPVRWWLLRKGKKFLVGLMWDVADQANANENFSSFHCISVYLLIYLFSFHMRKNRKLGHEWRLYGTVELSCIIVYSARSNLTQIVKSSRIVQLLQAAIGS